jgi:8-amino-7-oxononanoate synthase
VMVNRSRSFIFSTAPLPVLAVALGAGLDMVDREPERRLAVHRKSALLRRALGEAGLSAFAEASTQSPIVPIIAGSNEAALAVQSELMAAGFDVRAIRPPSVPVGTARLRVTVRYPTSDSDLLRFASEVARVMNSRAA